MMEVYPHNHGGSFMGFMPGVQVRGVLNEPASGIEAGKMYTVASEALGHLFMVKDAEGRRFAARESLMVSAKQLDEFVISLFYMEGGYDWSEVDEFVKDEYYKKVLEAFAALA